MMESIDKRGYASVLILAVLGTAFVRFVLNYFSRNERALRRIPGPFYSSYTNLPLKWAVITGSRTSFLHKLHSQYGPFVRISPNEISIVDPEATKTIHRAGSGYWKAQWYADFLDRPVQTLFVMGDPKAHGARRKMFSRAFSKTEMRMRWEPMVKQTVGLAIDKMAQDMATSGKADMLKWWTFMATDISTHLMFGASFHTLESGEVHNYMRVLQVAGQGGAIANELPLAGFIGRMIPHPIFRDLFHSNDYLMEFGEKAIKHGLQQTGRDTASIFAQLETFEDHAAPGAKGQQQQQQQPLSLLDLSNEAGNFIIAGTDTTAFTMTCVVWAVMRHPAIRAALEDELAALDDGFSDAQLEALPLLNAVISETLRLYGPAAGSLPRAVPEGGVVFGDYFIPENMIVSTQAWTLHRDERFWPDPEKFDPYRWFSDSIQTSSRNAYMPFGTGSRICIGIHLAEMEIRIATALFFRRCRRVRLSDECPKTLEFQNYFLLKPKGRCTIVSE